MSKLCSVQSIARREVQMAKSMKCEIYSIYVQYIRTVYTDIRSISRDIASNHEHNYLNRLSTGVNFNFNSF